MRYLLDTMVISESVKRSPNAAARAWIADHDPQDFAVSVVSLMEIHRGALAVRESAPEFSRRLSLWLEDVIAAFAGRILPVDIRCALRWSALIDDLKRRDEDVLIAATALEHGAIVVTRNEKHFQRCGLDTINPFQSRGV
jgi:toxin FitB